MLRTIRLAVALASVSLVLPLHAQSPVAGKWAADFELGMRNVNGEVTSTGTGHARISLEVKGDSVFGTWQVLDPAPPAGVPAMRPLKGVLKDGMLVLETDATERRIRMNDEDKIVRMLTRYELKLEGDSLTGTTRQIAVNGEMDPPARPFKAVREKS